MKVPLVDLSRQHAQIREEVEEGLQAVMTRTAFIQGEEVGHIEAEFAQFCDVAHCVGVGSGTDALEMSVRALGIGSGDKVVVPANSFIASALGVVRAGADVVLVDCDPGTYLIDVEAAGRALEDPSVKAVMPVHLFGQIAPMEQLIDAAPGVAIIEDAAQSQGATRHGRRAGSIGTVAGTSFYPGKNIGAYGDAGAVLTNDPDIAETVRHMANWGSSEKYHHPIIGFNSRLDTVQAVVLAAKLRRLDDWNKQRSLAADYYSTLLDDEERIGLPVTLDGNEHVWHLYVVRVHDRDRVVAELHAHGVGVGIHYPVPMHLQGALSHLGHGPGDFPLAEQAAREMISLPIFPGITESEQEYVVERLLAALKD